MRQKYGPEKEPATQRRYRLRRLALFYFSTFVLWNLRLNQSRFRLSMHIRECTSTATSLTAKRSVRWVFCGAAWHETSSNPARRSAGQLTPDFDLNSKIQTSCSRGRPATARQRHERLARTVEEHRSVGMLCRVVMIRRSSSEPVLGIWFASTLQRDWEAYLLLLWCRLSTPTSRNPLSYPWAVVRPCRWITRIACFGKLETEFDPCRLCFDAQACRLAWPCPSGCLHHQTNHDLCRARPRDGRVSSRSSARTSRASSRSKSLKVVRRLPRAAAGARFPDRENRSECPGATMRRFADRR